MVRTIPQAEGVERLLAEQGRKMDTVLFFEIADQVILDRLTKRRETEGRADDDPVAVKTRLDAYRVQRQTQLRLLDIQAVVKEAQIELERVLGEELGK